jgi:hypothetical protein
MHGLFGVAIVVSDCRALKSTTIGEMQAAWKEAIVAYIIKYLKWV